MCVWGVCVCVSDHEEVLSVQQHHGHFFNFKKNFVFKIVCMSMCLYGAMYMSIGASGAEGMGFWVRWTELRSSGKALYAHSHWGSAPPRHAQAYYCLWSWCSSRWRHWRSWRFWWELVHLLRFRKGKVGFLCYWIDFYPYLRVFLIYFGTCEKYIRN